jgi:myo-inositol 2-dehydrogenase/D-chiro-inositol 1-dehydrogenase
MGDTPPISAVGLGGRQARVEPIYGHIFDHHAVVYEWAGGMKMFAFCRQQDGCTSDVDDYILGTKGRATVLKNRIEGETTWKYRGDKNNMYQTEHDELFAAIRSGTPINNGHYMSVSTMVAIMGRMATYSGKKITWDQAINSTEDLTPAAYNWGPLETPLVAIPGQTQLVV